MSRLTRLDTDGAVTNLACRVATLAEMNRRSLSLFRGGTAAVALCTGALAAQAVLPSGSATADVCADVGNKVTVTTCTDLSDVVGELLTPGRPDRGPGNRTPNMYSCLGWDGQWLEADSCT